MAKVMVLTGDTVYTGPQDEWWYQSDTACTVKQGIMEATPYRRSLRTRLMARRAMTIVGKLPGTPGGPSNFQHDTSPYFVGVFAESPLNLPRLTTPQSNFRSSKPTKAFYERLARGDIVINPMRTSSLKLHNTYAVKPGRPSSASSMTFNALSMRPEPIPRGKCNRDLFLGPDGNLRSQTYAPTLLPTQGSGAQYRGVYSILDHSDLTTVADLYGMTDERLSFYRQELDHYIADLPRDTGLITKVVGDTRAGTYDILTDVAEARSTFQLIFSLVIRFFTEYVNVKRRIASKHDFLVKQRELLSRKTEKAFDAAQRRELRRISKEVQDLSNEWLQFRYGIGPLIKSLDDAVKWLKEREYEYAKFRGTSNFAGGLLKLGDLELTVTNVTDRAFGKVRVDSVTGGLKINPIATAVELIPLSFLLNWVCNIGDFVSALWPPQGVSQEVFTYSRSIPVETAISGKLGNVPLSFSYGYYRIDTITPYEGLAVQLDLSLTWKRIVDAFALAYGPLRRAAYNR